jgi:hypothetical protein
MKFTLILIFTMVFKIASSQCSQVTIETISDFVAYNMESVIETNEMRNSPDQSPFIFGISSSIIIKK